MADVSDSFPLGRYLDKLVEQLRELTPRALGEQDAKAIHQARVATRRLQAAIDLAEPVTGKSNRKPMGKALRALRRQLGSARDLDVMLKHLDHLQNDSRHRPAIEWAKAQLLTERESVTIKNNDDPARWLTRLGSWWGLRHELHEAAGALATLLAESSRAQIEHFAAEAEKLAGESADQPGAGNDPHALRIAGKSLRYTLEMADRHGCTMPARVRRLFKRMQDALGLWHDYVVLTEKILALAVKKNVLHADVPLMENLLSLSRKLARGSSQHLRRFSRQWNTHGQWIVEQINAAFPLTRPVNPATASS